MTLFSGFREFWESRLDNFASTVKKQLGVPKKLWLGMPVVLSNIKLGNHYVRQPVAFYVTDFDSHTVTISPVPDSGLDRDASGNDVDDDIDLDPADRLTTPVTITRDNFMKLMEPPNFQGADFATAAGGGGGGMPGGGMGGM